MGFLEKLRLFFTDGFDDPGEVADFVLFVKLKEVWLGRNLYRTEIANLYRAWKNGAISIT